MSKHGTLARVIVAAATLATATGCITFSKADVSRALANGRAAQSSQYNPGISGTFDVGTMRNWYWDSNPFSASTRSAPYRPFQRTPGWQF